MPPFFCVRSKASSPDLKKTSINQNNSKRDSKTIIVPVVPFFVLVLKMSPLSIVKSNAVASLKLTYLRKTTVIGKLRGRQTISIVYRRVDETRVVNECVGGIFTDGRRLT